jgi:nitroimidazol reductase NimA-like FMN-containing flavoprotein (pyridoxamine 5'-phosphate oxidase superfamily)
VIHEFPKTARNKVKRHPERGAYDPAVIYPIVDEALICHVGFIQDNQPYIIPTLHARQDDTILLHGAKGSRLLRYIEAGGDVCITITLIDGIVLARSAFSHSVNYRSAVLFGKGQMILDDDARMQALELFTERLIPGRWQDVRPPNAVELKQTTIVAVPIESASAKVRSGPPKDGQDDLDWPAWAGVLPLQQVSGVAIPDPQLVAPIEVPEYIRDYRRPTTDQRPPTDNGRLTTAD